MKTTKKQQYIDTASQRYHLMRARLGSGSGIYGDRAIEAKKFFRDADRYAKQFGMTTTRFFQDVCNVAGC